MNMRPRLASPGSGGEIWSLVTLLRTLPNMSDEEYQDAVKYYEAAGKGGVHHH